jgi:hypothetical protein
MVTRNLLRGVAFLFAMGAVASVVAAIWSHGTDLPGRFVGTAFLCVFVAFLSGVGGWVE